MARPAPATLEAWRLVLEIHQNLTGRLDRDLRDRHGIRLTWYDVLFQLNEAGGRLRMHALAEAALFSRTDCTRVVDRMARAGLVTREPAADDGRGVVAVLTTQGKATLRRAAVTHLDGIERYFGAAIGPGGSEAIVGALGGLAGAAGKA